MIEKIENIQLTKKAKLYYSPSILSKESTHFRDKTSLQLKIIQKKNADYKLVNQIKKWHKYYKRKFE